MGDRVIRAGILTSEAVDALSCGAEVFYRRLMSVVDDYGRYDGRLKILLASLYPLKIGEVSLVDVENWLKECVDQDLVFCYWIDGHAYLQLEKFNQRVRQKVQKWPAPDGRPPQPSDPSERAREDEGSLEDEPSTIADGVEAIVPSDNRDYVNGRTNDSGILSDASLSSDIGQHVADNGTHESRIRIQNPNPESEKELTSSSNSRGNSPPRSKSRSPDPRKDTPAIRACLEIGAKYPPKPLWDRIIALVGPEPDVGKLRECFEAWIGASFSPQNWAWLTEWYLKGIPERIKGKGHGANQPVKFESREERNNRNTRRTLEILGIVDPRTSSPGNAGTQPGDTLIDLPGPRRMLSGRD